MSKKVYSWKEQLSIGEEGEARFQLLWRAAFNSQLLKAPTRDFDFVTPDGKALELKSDNYDPAKTPNFFFERFSVLAQQKPGGPWQSWEKGADIFVYQFLRTNEAYIFQDIPQLIGRIDYIVHEHALKPRKVANRTYFASGYAIERELFKDLYTYIRLELP
jgi:hypothetical protein